MQVADFDFVDTFHQGSSTWNQVPEDNLLLSFFAWTIMQWPKKIEHVINMEFPQTVIG